MEPLLSRFWLSASLFLILLLLTHLQSQSANSHESSVVRQVAQIQRWTRLIFSPRASLVESADERFKHNLSKLFPPDDLTFAFSPARWPMECQVSPEKIHHLDSCPEEPELFYTPSGYEPKPQPVGEEEGIVVYQYLPTCAVNFFCRSSEEGRGQLNEAVFPPLPPPLTRDTVLKFESRFESGNLAKAIRISECFYELHLRADLYTAKHTQWYYFSVENMRTDITYRFSIVNLSKRDSLYNHGLRPLCYSDTLAKLEGIGWSRCGHNIAYFKNSCYDDDDEDYGCTYTLTFNITFPYEGDRVFFAHCYPYTYTQLQEFLMAIQSDPVRASVCKQRVLCHSQAGNQVYLLTITERFPTMIPEEKKPVILLTSRVHPGETPASWIMQGLIDYLTSREYKAQTLREKFIFKIIPMLNPDGVIVGNYRCSLSGKDLNRQYRNVVKDTFPTIWHLKTLIRRLTDDHLAASSPLFFYCDFHGHSRKHNVFMYGCERKGEDLSEQLFPLLMSHMAPNTFSFQSCRFHVRKEKEGTARVVTANSFGVRNSFTLEASLGGSTLKGKPGCHFSSQDYKNVGKYFCDTLVEFSDKDPSKERLRARILSCLSKRGSSAEEPTAIDIGDLAASDSEESNSDCEKISESEKQSIGDRREADVTNPRTKQIKKRGSSASLRSDGHREIPLRSASSKDVRLTRTYSSPVDSPSKAKKTPATPAASSKTSMTPTKRKKAFQRQAKLASRLSSLMSRKNGDLKDNSSGGLERQMKLLEGLCPNEATRKPQPTTTIMAKTGNFSSSPRRRQALARHELPLTRRSVWPLVRRVAPSPPRSRSPPPTLRHISTEPLSLQASAPLQGVEESVAVVEAVETITEEVVLRSTESTPSFHTKEVIALGTGFLEAPQPLTTSPLLPSSPINRSSSKLIGSACKAERTQSNTPPIERDENWRSPEISPSLRATNVTLSLASTAALFVSKTPRRSSNLVQNDICDRLCKGLPSTPTLRSLRKALMSPPSPPRETSNAGNSSRGCLQSVVFTEDDFRSCESGSTSPVGRRSRNLRRRELSTSFHQPKNSARNSGGGEQRILCTSNTSSQNPSPPDSSPTSKACYGSPEATERTHPSPSSSTSPPGQSACQEPIFRFPPSEEQARLEKRGVLPAFLKNRCCSPKKYSSGPSSRVGSPAKPPLRKEGSCSNLRLGDSDRAAEAETTPSIAAPEFLNPDEVIPRLLSNALQQGSPCKSETATSLSEHVSVVVKIPSARSASGAPKKPMHHKKGHGSGGGARKHRSRGPAGAATGASEEGTSKPKGLGKKHKKRHRRPHSTTGSTFDPSSTVVESIPSVCPD